MKGLEFKQTIRTTDYSLSVESGDQYDAANASELRLLDLISMQKYDWLRAYKRTARLTVNQLEQILASSYDMTQLIAAALRLADLVPCQDWFRKATALAQTSTMEQIESSLYYLKKKEEFVTSVLAMVHYELFGDFELGQWVARVEIIQADGQMYRRYTNP